MARIIVEPDSKREKRVRCKKCERLVAYLPEDVRGPDGCRYVVCPACNEWILLEVGEEWNSRT